MDNYNYPMGADNEHAPWNEETLPDCPECGCDQFIPTGEYTFECALCGYEEDNEPDWESLIDFE